MNTTCESCQRQPATTVVTLPGDGGPRTFTVCDGCTPAEVAA